MPSQGPRYPATTANLSNAGSSENTDAWVNPGNVGADDGTESQITAATFDSPDISQILVASNFGFTIPSDATISGIVVEIDRRDFAGAASDNRVQLAKGTAFANLVGNNKADTALDWPGTSTVKSYGGTTDLWGATWTPTEINASSFAVFLSVQADAANTDVGVDFIRVTVHYTGGTIQQSVSGSLSFTGAIVKRISRSVSAALGFAGAITKRTDRSVGGSVGFTGAVTKRSAKGQTATVTFSTSFSPELLAPGTPALVIIHIHTE